MKTWLDKLCDPLEHPQYPQMKGKLYFYENGELIGKCAEGEIACQNGLKLSATNKICLHEPEFVYLSVPVDLLNGCPKFLYYQEDADFAMDSPFGGLENYIYELNDRDFTYKQIVEFLRTTFEDAV